MYQRKKFLIFYILFQFWQSSLLKFYVTNQREVKLSDDVGEIHEMIVLGDIDSVSPNFFALRERNRSECFPISRTATILYGSGKIRENPSRSTSHA